MNLLQIFIPENFSPVEQSRCPWVLREAAGRVLRSGESAPHEMPKADAVQVVAPAAKVLLTSVRVPTRNRQKMLKLLPFAVEEKLMYDPETIHVAAGLRQASDDVPVAVIDRRWMESVMGALQQAGLRPRVMWPEPLLPKPHAGAWTVVWDGSAGFIKTGEFAGVSMDGGSAEAPPLALVLAVQEAKQAGRAPKRVSLRLSGGAQAPDVEQWAARLEVPVSQDKAWDWAAEACQSAPAINLLQGEFAPAGLSADWLPRLKPALILGGLIVALQLGGGAVDWAFLSYEKHKLQADMEKSFRQAFPEAKTVVDASLQMRRNLADLRHAAGQPDSSDLLPLLAKAAPVLAGVANIQYMQYERGMLKLELRLQSGSVADLRGRLGITGLNAEFDNPAAKAGAAVKLILTEGRG